MKTTRIRVTIMLISMMLSVICSVMLMDVLGLSFRDSFHILTNREPFPIYLNTDAFQTAKDDENAAWFVIDKHSLSPIANHALKAYKTQSFNPQLPAVYYLYIREEHQRLLIYSGAFFMVAWGVWFYGLNRVFGSRYAEAFYRAGRKSVEDPTPPYQRRIDELETELCAAKTAAKQLTEKLTIYRQEKGPIKVKTIIITSEELSACRKLRISPKEYLEKHKRKRGSDKSEGKARERVRF